MDEFRDSDRIYAAAFSPDSQMLVLAYRSNKLVFYDVPSRREISSISRTTESLLGPQLFAGWKDAVAGANGGIEFWRVSTRELLGISAARTALNTWLLNPDAVIVVHPGCLELLHAARASEIPGSSAGAGD